MNKMSTKKEQKQQQQTEKKKVTADDLGEIFESKRRNVRTFMENEDYLIQRATE